MSKSKRIVGRKSVKKNMRNKTRTKKRGGSFWTRMTTGCDNSKKLICYYQTSKLKANICPSQLNEITNDNPAPYGYETSDKYVICNKKRYMKK